MAERTSGFLRRAVFAVALLVLAAAVDVYIAGGGEVKVLIYGVAGAIAACGLAAASGRLKFEIKVRDGWIAAAIAVVCFCVKLVAVLRWRVLPEADYETFHIVARDLAESGSISVHRYVALFPHIFGYSSFLSVFYRIFGSGQLVAPIVNAVLSAATAALLYLLVRRFASKKAGILAAAIWTACPSQTLYNIYVLSEPLYTCELVGALLVADTLRRRVVDGQPIVKVAIAAAGLGVLLGAIQLARPIGIIVLIALGGVLLVIDLPYNIKGAGLRVGALLLTAVVMLCCTRLVGLRIDSALGEPRATSVGYSYAVGLNEEYGGRWSPDISAKLTEYNSIPGMSANDVQERMMQDVKRTLKEGNVEYVPLFGKKLVSLLGDDSAAVTNYGMGVFIHWELFRDVCNGFYIGACLLGALGAFIALLRKERGPLLLTALYGVGLVAAQMLVEVSPRYHYSLWIVMIPMAVYALGEIAHIFGRRKTDGQLS